jgi:hypothetical protein
MRKTATVGAIKGQIFCPFHSVPRWKPVRHKGGSNRRGCLHTLTPSDLVTWGKSIIRSDLRPGEYRGRHQSGRARCHGPRSTQPYRAHCGLLSVLLRSIVCPDGCRCHRRSEPPRGCAVTQSKGQSLKNRRSCRDLPCTDRKTEGGSLKAGCTRLDAGRTSYRRSRTHLELPHTGHLPPCTGRVISSTYRESRCIDPHQAAPTFSFVALLTFQVTLIVSLLAPVRKQAALIVNRSH